jgi:hypothetical protein
MTFQIPNSKCVIQNPTAGSLNLELRILIFFDPDSRRQSATERVMRASDTHYHGTAERRDLLDFDFDIRKQAERREML